MRSFISKNFASLIAIILFVIIILQRCGGNGEIPKNTHDTTVSVQYHYIKDTGYSKPQIISTHRDTTLENTYYIPSDDYEELRNQFDILKEALLSKNIYKDNLKIDSFGTVELTDTIQQNKIIGRRYINNLTIPTKTITINNTISPKAKNQFYFGGGIMGNQLKPIQEINVGILLKNKRDQIFGINTGLDLNGNLTYGIQSYWKIKLHK